jgi:hypothetical protein
MQFFLKANSCLWREGRKGGRKERREGREGGDERERGRV